MALYLGLDCGGTSTRALVRDEDGATHFVAESGPGNLASIPEDVLLANLAEALEGCPPVTACAGCFAGLLTPADRMRALTLLKKFVDAESMEAYPDYYAALYADPEMDMIIISGTGSLVASKYQGSVVKSGGGGPLLGDEGSTFDIGKRALVGQILRAHPAEASDLFWQEVVNQFGSREPNHAIAAVYRSLGPAARLAKLVPAVAIDYNRGLAYADEAVSGGLGALAQTTVRHLRGYHEEAIVRVGLAGGLWDIDSMFSDKFADLLSEKLESELLKCEPMIAILESKPIEGAIFLAQQLTK